MNDTFSRLLSLSVSGALVALAVFVVVRIGGKRLSQTWRYYIWLVVLLRWVVPFAPPQANLIDALARQSINPAPFVQQVVADVPQTDYALMSNQAPNEADSESRSMQEHPTQTGKADLIGILADLRDYAWVVWLGVSMMLLVRAITNYRSFVRFIRAGWKPIDNPVFLDTLDEVCSSQRIRKPPPLYVNPLASSPMLVGLLRPVIVLPTCDLQPEELAHILSHELTHYKRGDILYKWFVQLVSCLHWFNPVVYLVKKDVNIACDLSCDERVLTRLEEGSRKRYGDTLLSVIRTSGSYGDATASVTMCEEGKMMKTRLQSILVPHKGSKLTVALALMLSILLCVGAAYAGAYTGAPAAAAVDDQLPESTQNPTPGEQLDKLLGDVDGLVDSVGVYAKDFSDEIVDRVTGYTDGLSDKISDRVDKFANNLSDKIKTQVNAWSGDISVNWFTDENMFSSTFQGSRVVLHRGYYGNGYIVHLKYDSSAQRTEGDLAIPTEPNVVVPDALRAYTDDAVVMETLKDAASHFLQAVRMPQVSKGFLTLVAVYGPYEEAPDALLNRFYQEGGLDFFIAVLNSGQTSAEQRKELLYAAVEDEDVAVISILLDEEVAAEDADALFVTAYENRDVAVFNLLVDYASAAARQEMVSRATRDGEYGFLACMDEEPGKEAIDAMIDDPESLNPAALSMISDYLTQEQALRIAEAAYEQGNVASFSIVMDSLSDEDIQAFHERAYQDKNMAFMTLTEA